MRRLLAVALVFSCLFGAPAPAQEKSIVVASTTSTEDSGLFGHLLPRFTAATGIAVKVIAQGTGQALDTARRGDADVVFVHARAAEEKFLAEGFGVKRYPVMYNDFVLIGPKADPAGIAGGHDIVAALKAIKEKAAPFVSRGDRSGTHIAELNLWQAAGIDISAAKGAWYRDIGQGMGAALNTASAMDAYVLSDRHVALVQEPRRSRNRHRRRPAPVQPIWRDAGEPREASACEEGMGPGFHRLADFADGPAGDRRLQDRGEAIILPQRRRAGSVSGETGGGIFAQISPS